MRFIQLIDYKTTRVDEVQTLLTRWIETTGGIRTATRTTVGRDKNDPTHFIEILQFPDYEEACATHISPRPTRSTKSSPGSALNTQSSLTSTSSATKDCRTLWAEVSVGRVQRRRAG